MKNYIIGTAFGALLVAVLAFPAAAQKERSGGNGQAGNGGTTNSSGQNNAGASQHSSPTFAPQQRNTNTAPQQQRSNFNVTPRQGYVQGQPQRGAFYNGRTGVTQTPRTYRTYPASPYGSNHLAVVAPHGLSSSAYYNNRGYYRSYYAPQLGFRVNVLPFGYYPFYFGQYQYFYSDGLFYQFDNNDYTVVEPPVGAAITTLPDKAQSIVINGVQFYELNGVYYQPITKDDGTIVYQIAGKDGELNTDDNTTVQQPAAPPQVGDVVTSIPQDCKKIKLNGQLYYESSDGYYFQDTVDANGNKGYKIVGTPTDGPGN